MRFEVVYGCCWINLSLMLLLYIGCLKCCLRLLGDCEAVVNLLLACFMLFKSFGRLFLALLRCCQ